MKKEKGDGPYLLKSANEISNGLVGSVSHLVPAKVAQVVIGRLCHKLSAPPSTSSI